MRNSGFDDLSLLLGILIGFTTAVWLGLSPFMPVIFQEYQNIIVGLLTASLTLGGATGTIWIINRQIRAAWKIEEIRRRRKLDAAKAMLPMALSNICQYSRDTVSVLLEPVNDDTIHSIDGSTRVPRPSHIPKLPQQSLSILTECVEHGQHSIPRQLAELIRQMQSQSAWLSHRVTSSEADDWNTHQWHSMILRSVEIFARASALFDYADEETDHPRPVPSAEQMRAVARGMGLFEELWPDLYKMIEWRYHVR